MAARYNVRNPPNVDDIYPEIAEKYARYIEKRFPGVADEISKETVQHICIFYIDDIRSYLWTLLNLKL